MMLPWLNRLLSRLLQQRSDLCFDHEVSKRALPMIIAVMLCVALVMVAMVLSVRASVTQQDAQMQHMAYVEIPQAALKQKNALERITDLLKAQDYIRSVNLVSEQAMAKLLEPWIGGGQTLQGMELPVLLELEVKQSAEQETTVLPDWDALEKQLHTIHADVRLDASQPWLSAVHSVTQSLQWLGVVLALLLCLAIMAVVLLSVRSSLKLHAGTVKVLHRIGAEDSYILHQFDRYCAAMVLRGSLIGTVVGAVIFVALSLLVNPGEILLLPTLSTTTAHITMFVFAPLGLTALAVIMTHRVLAQQLKHYY